MGQVLRAGVIGAGVFGGYHAGKYAALPGVDPGRRLRPPRRARRGAGRDAAAARCSPAEAELIAAVDIVSIATPAIAHAAPGAWPRWRRAGRSMSKSRSPPTSRTPRRIAELAARPGRGRRLRLPGARGAAGDGPLRHSRAAAAAARRCAIGPPSPRNLDVSVVLDLMIHDLDLALALSPGEPADGGGRRRGGGQRARSTGSTPRPSSRTASSPASAPRASPRPASAACASSIRPARCGSTS